MTFKTKQSNLMRGRLSFFPLIVLSTVFLFTVSCNKATPSSNVEDKVEEKDNVGIEEVFKDAYKTLSPDGVVNYIDGAQVSLNDSVNTKGSAYETLNIYGKSTSDKESIVFGYTEESLAKIKATGSTEMYTKCYNSSGTLLKETEAQPISQGYMSKKYNLEDLCGGAINLNYDGSEVYMLRNYYTTAEGKNYHINYQFSINQDFKLSGLQDISTVNPGIYSSFSNTRWGIFEKQENQSSPLSMKFTPKSDGSGFSMVYIKTSLNKTTQNGMQPWVKMDSSMRSKIKFNSSPIIRIYDAYGKQLYQDTAWLNASSLSITDGGTGTYLAKFFTPYSNPPRQNQVLNLVLISRDDNKSYMRFPFIYTFN